MRSRVRSPGKSDIVDKEILVVFMLALYLDRNMSLPVRWDCEHDGMLAKAPVNHVKTV